MPVRIPRSVQVDLALRSRYEEKYFHHGILTKDLTMPRFILHDLFRGPMKRAFQVSFGLPNKQPGG